MWLGASKEPNKSPCDDDVGKWVAEDAEWRTRAKDEVLYLRPDNRLGRFALFQPFLIGHRFHHNHATNHAGVIRICAKRSNHYSRAVKALKPPWCPGR